MQENRSLVVPDRAVLLVLGVSWPEKPYSGTFRSGRAGSVISTSAGTGNCRKRVEVERFSEGK